MGRVSRLDVVVDVIKSIVMHMPEPNEWFPVAARGYWRVQINVIFLATDVETHILIFVSFNQLEYHRIVVEIK